MNPETIGDALDLYLGDGQPHRTGEIVSYVAKQMGVAEASVNVALSRRASDGRYIKPKRGYYQLPHEGNGETNAATGSGTTIGKGALAFGIQRVAETTGVARYFQDGVKLTIYTEVKASAGSGTVIYDEESRVELDLPRLLLKEMLGFIPPSRMGALECVGDSMEPLFMDGDLLLYEPLESINGGGIYAFMADDVLMVKRLQRFVGGAIRVKSENPVYADETLLPAEDGHYQSDQGGASVALRIVGKIVWPRPTLNRMDIYRVQQIFGQMIEEGVFQQR